MHLDPDSDVLLELRDRLLGLGRRSRVPGAPPDAEDEGLQASLARIQPFAELMFLIMNSDDERSESERTALRGAFRALTGSRFPSSVLDGMVEELAGALAREGRDARLEDVCARLATDPEDAEGAFTLAAAMALADGRLAPEELVLLETVARWLRLDRTRADSLLARARENG